MRESELTMTRQIGFARLLAGSRIVFVIATCVGGLLVPAASADTINFDNVANGTVINSAYAGLTFSNPLGGDIYARSTSLAASPPRVSPIPVITSVVTTSIIVRRKYFP